MQCYILVNHFTKIISIPANHWKQPVSSSFVTNRTKSFQNFELCVVAYHKPNKSDRVYLKKSRIR